MDTVITTVCFQMSGDGGQGMMVEMGEATTRSCEGSGFNVAGRQLETAADAGGS